MRRLNLNVFVGTLAFICLLFIVAVGIVMEYLLHVDIGQHNTIWGLDRHTWGNVHLGLTFVLFIALTVLVCRHWNAIVAVLRGRSREGPGTCVGLVIVMVGLIALAVGPFLSPMEQVVTTRVQIDAVGSSSDPLEALTGSMTLDEVIATTGVSRDCLQRELGLPPGAATNETVDSLGSEYGFSLSDLRNAVRSYPHLVRRAG